jgi:hypothetical protein
MAGTQESQADENGCSFQHDGRLHCGGAQTIDARHGDYPASAAGPCIRVVASISA